MASETLLKSTEVNQFFSKLTNAIITFPYKEKKTNTSSRNVETVDRPSGFLSMLNSKAAHETRTSV